MLRVKSTTTESLNCIPVKHIGEVCVIPLLNLLNFVRSSETVKEMKERNSAFNSCKVSNSSKVHTFLRIVWTKHCITCLTASVDIWVVTKNRKFVACERTGWYMNNARKKLACHLVHIRNHKEQALWCCVSCGQSTCCEWAVNSTWCAALRLHFRYLNLSAEKVLGTLCRELVGKVSHYGRRCNRIDSRNIGKRIRNMSYCAVTIHSFHFSCQWNRPPF